MSSPNPQRRIENREEKDIRRDKKQEIKIKEGGENKDEENSKTKEEGSDEVGEIYDNEREEQNLKGQGVFAESFIR